MRRLVLLLGLALLYPGVASGQTECYVTLQWDANTEPDLAFYSIHYGQAVGVYSARLDVDKTRTTLAIPLPEGRRYYFAARATNSAGVTSGYSNEVTTLVSCTATGEIRIPSRISSGVEATVCPKGVCGT
jgi:hypothetical protein